MGELVVGHSITARGLKSWDEENEENACGWRLLAADVVYSFYALKPYFLAKRDG
jgi:hypothetical protein